MTAAALIELALAEGFSMAAACNNENAAGTPQSFLTAGLVYGNDHTPPDFPADDTTAVYGIIAPFARKNYYRLASQKLKNIAQKLNTIYHGKKSDYPIYCNSTRINEKHIAVECGLAVQGRHSLLLTKEFGSLFIIGILGLPFLLEDAGASNPNVPFSRCNHCDSENSPCRAACPTGALTGSGLIKERCIQWYLSGHGDSVPDMVIQHWGNRLYGCTLCQDACPFNQKTIQGVECTIGQLPAVMDVGRIVQTPDDELKKLFHGTALGGSWLCPSGLKRSAAICLQ